MFKLFKNLFKKKYSYEELEETKKQMINHQYGKYSFGDKIVEDGVEYLFITTQQGCALLFRVSDKELRYITVDHEKLVEHLKQQSIEV